MTTSTSPPAAPEAPDSPAPPAPGAPPVAAPPARSPRPAPASTVSTRSIMAPMVTVIVGTFMVVLDNTVVNVALPQLGRVFGAELSLLQWVITAYFLAQAAVIRASVARRWANWLPSGEADFGSLIATSRGRWQS